MLNIPQRRIILGTTDIDSGTFWSLFGMDMKNLEEVTISGMCTGAFPIAFPYQKIVGFHCVDGGLILNLNIEDAVKFCENTGFTQNETIIDAIMPSWLKDIKKNVTGFTSIAMIKRVL